LIERDVIEFEVCQHSGQLPWDCGLSACENGCATKTVEFVPLATYRGAVGLLDALDGYVSHREDCDALSGAPECSCGFDELYTRVRAAVRSCSVDPQ